MTAIQEHALNVRWCKRHVGTGRRYRRGKGRCHKCGYRLPRCGAAVWNQLLRQVYAPALIKMLADETPILAMFEDPRIKPIPELRVGRYDHPVYDI
jgi:hypothetical protein